MKKSMKRLFVICAVVALVFSLSVAASAESLQMAIDPMSTNLQATWASDTVSVPGTNGSGFSSVSTYKATSTQIASFKCTSKSIDRNFDARLVNTLGESRSAWARNLDINTLIHVAENGGAVVGYLYSCEISSDLFTTGSVDVGIDFSPDSLS